MYVGEMFTRNYPSLKWDYRTKPKTDIHMNEPFISGFQVEYQGQIGSVTFEPIHMARV